MGITHWKRDMVLTPAFRSIQYRVPQMCLARRAKSLRPGRGEGLHRKASAEFTVRTPNVHRLLNVRSHPAYWRGTFSRLGRRAF